MDKKNSKKLPIFAERITNLRKFLNMTQAEFSKFVEISRTTAVFYESGERLPDALVLARICQKCNVSSDWLLGLTEDRQRTPSAIDDLGLTESAANAIKSLTKSDNIHPDAKLGIRWTPQEQKYLLRIANESINNLFASAGFCNAINLVKEACVERYDLLAAGSVYNGDPNEARRSAETLAAKLGFGIIPVEDFMDYYAMRAGNCLSSAISSELQVNIEDFQFFAKATMFASLPPESKILQVIQNGEIEEKETSFDSELSDALSSRYKKGGD